MMCSIIGLAFLEESDEPRANPRAPSFNYLGAGDRALVKGAVALECDAFLAMENKRPKAATHIQKPLGIRVLSPIEMWKILKPWAALFQ